MKSQVRQNEWERERDGLKDMRIVLISKEWFAAASSTHHIQKPTKQAKKNGNKIH